jgi:hypothetical protein
VVHTAEGATTYQSLGSYFANPSSGVSSHTGIDDTPNVVGEYVARGNKAWTQANANPYSVATELCAFAAWTPNEWNAHPGMLQNCAQWIAEEAAVYGIPIRKLNSSEAQGGSAGICGHVDLGVSGGNHWDPGPNFPWNSVISMAQGTTPPPPNRGDQGEEMIASTDNWDGYWIVKPDGAVYAFGAAQFKGGANSPNIVQPGQCIVGIAGKSNDGYWLTSSDGAVYSFGNVQYYGRADR